MKYHKIVEPVVTELEELDELRENVIKFTRKLNRTAGRGIAKLVKKENYSENLEESRRLLIKIWNLMVRLAPISSWNITNSGAEEYAELELLHSIVTSQELPSPKNIKIPSWIWISALGDVIGELRRMMLNELISDNIHTAKLHLTSIQNLYNTIVGLEFSKSLVPNLRRKIDIARTLIDKSESDFLHAVVNKRTRTL